VLAYGQPESVRVYPMALDPEEIVALLLIATLAIAWNWRLGH
jgi:hypothetical protein